MAKILALWPCGAFGYTALMTHRGQGRVQEPEWRALASEIAQQNVTCLAGRGDDA